MLLVKIIYYIHCLIIDFKNDDDLISISSQISVPTYAFPDFISRQRTDLQEFPINVSHIRLIH